jgi:phage gp45-like
VGLIATLFNLTRSARKIKGNAPGESVVANGSGFPGQEITAEVYQAPGVFSAPGDGVKGVWLPVGGSSRYGVVIACQNYKITFDITQGETAIYSTPSAGGSIAAKIILRADGTIEINGDSKQFVTWSELNTALQSHTHSAGALVAPSGGGPVTGSTGAPVALDLSAAQTTTVKTGG